MTASQDRLSEYARLVVRVGLNLQPGQVLGINALLEQAPLARAVAREAYIAGAKYVDVLYTDQHVRRAHVEGGRFARTEIVGRKRFEAHQLLGIEAFGPGRLGVAAREEEIHVAHAGRHSTDRASRARGCARSPRRACA